MAMRTTAKPARSPLWACLALFLALLIVFASATAAFADEGGEGSEVIAVSTLQELSAVSDRVAVGDSMAGVVVQLQNDIDMASVNFEPIGTSLDAKTSGVPFAGTFDGQGFSLKGLKVYTTTSEMQLHQWHGLFGACDGATIKNLVIDGCNVSSDSMMSSFVCVLCPEVANSVIENVELTGELTCKAGMVLTADNTIFKDCVLDYSTSELSSGIVKEATNGCVIEGCSATGALDSSVSKDGAFGIMAGRLTDSTIVSCTNDADVTGRMNEAGYMGSIVGYATRSTVTDCVNNGLVTLTNEGTNNNREPVGGYVGGIAGGLEKSSLSRCFNYGDISNQSTQQGSPGRSADPQTEYPGGIASIAIRGSTIDSCASTGDIDIDLLGYYACYSNVGGLIAQLRGSTMTNCYNTGDMYAKLTTMFSSKEPVKLQFKGNGIALIIDDDAVVSNCYNTGTIGYELLKPVSLESYVDCVSLNCQGQLDSVYYYRGSWPAESALGKALTAAQMKEQDSFAGFDFENTWMMDSGEFGLPVLRAEGEVDRVTLPEDVDLTTAAIDPIASVVYNGSAQTPEVKLMLGEELLREGVDYALAYSKNTNAGTAKVVATGLGRCLGTLDASFTISKASNVIKLKKSKATYKVKKLKKKAQKFSIGATASTKVKYKLSSAAKRAGMKVTAKGKVTVKKGTKKGTYKITVSAAGTANYKAAKNKTVTVKVKK